MAEDTVHNEEEVVPEHPLGSKENPMTPEEFKEKHGVEVSEETLDEGAEEDEVAEPEHA